MLDGSSIDAFKEVTVKDISADEDIGKEYKKDSQGLQNLRGILLGLSRLALQNRIISSRLALAFLAALSGKALLTCSSLLFKQAVDALAVNSNVYRHGVFLLLLYGVTKLIGQCIHHLHRPIFYPVSYFIGQYVTKDALQRVYGLGSAWYNSIKIGSISYVVDRAILSVVAIVNSVFFILLPSAIEFILVFALIGLRGWWLTLLVISITALIYINWTLKGTEKLGTQWNEVQGAWREASGTLMDSLINYEAVSLYGCGKHEAMRFNRLQSAGRRRFSRFWWLQWKMYIGQDTVFMVCYTLVLLFAALAKAQSGASLGDIVMVSVLLQQVWRPLESIGGERANIENNMVNVRNLIFLAKTTRSIKEPRNAKALKVKGGEIVFDNVTFTYRKSLNERVGSENGEKEGQKARKLDHNDQNSGSSRAIGKVSFRVPAGCTAAIVGESGSGKSSILRLLRRLYDVDSGRILIDGQDISQATLESVKDAITMIPQDVTLFNESIAWNIRYGRPGASMTEVIGAAKAAKVHNAIMNLPSGYDSVCGERGRNMSGGERQRVIAARAILKGGEILLQDEATSSLDVITESSVAAALSGIAKGKTSIIVAHRLSTIAGVDWIIVMDQGKIVEEGANEELMQKTNGRYKKMLDHQNQLARECSSRRPGAETQKL